MPKNTKGGKKTKFMKKKSETPVMLDAIKPDNITTYVGVISKALGCYRFSITVPSFTDIKALLPGSLRKGPRVNVGDMVLFQIETTLSNTSGFILHLYNDAELNALKITKFRVNDQDSAELDELFHLDTDDVEFNPVERSEVPINIDDI